MKLYRVITNPRCISFSNNYSYLKYIEGTQYVYYKAKLHKSSNSNFTLSKIWEEGIRIKINETI